MRSFLLFAFCCMLLFSACESKETRDVRRVFENGQDDEVYVYMDDDSLNRKEIKYYSNGTLLSTGQRADGQKDGTWRSYHLDGSLWSIHEYEKGLQVSEYFVWHRNGNLRISGAYDQGEETGMWYFMSEAGDTIRVVNFDDVH